MSRQTARIALDQISGKPALLAPQYAGAGAIDEVTSNGMLADLRELARANVATEEQRWQDRKPELTSAYGYDDEAQDSKIFAFANGKAIIPIHGMLINRFNYSWSFATGYNFIRTQVEAARNDPDVDGIILDVSSYGGMCAGCPETADLIYASSARQGGKPIIAVVDANCYSAAYMLACSADRIVVTPSGGAGSIGVVVMHMDVSKALDEAGIKVTFIYAGAQKVAGNPYEPLSDAAKADYQSIVDTLYGKFVATVARGRGLDEQAVRDTEARCYLADEALTKGLIDAVQAPNDAVEAFFNTDPDAADPDDDDTDPERNDDMSATKPTAEPVATAAPAPAAAPAGPDPVALAAEARTAERARISGIQGHAEAAGREALASHLALNTDMSVEAAAGILAASPKAAAPAAAAPASEVTSNATNHFQNAMANTPNPNVGAGGEPGSGKTEQTGGNRILASQAKAFGFKPAQNAGR